MAPEMVVPEDPEVLKTEIEESRTADAMHLIDRLRDEDAKRIAAHVLGIRVDETI